MSLLLLLRQPAPVAFGRRSLPLLLLYAPAPPPAAPVVPRFDVQPTVPVGAVDARELDDTWLSTGAVGVSGSVASTEADDTCAAAGAIGASGSVAATEADDAWASSGAVGVAGSLALAEQGDAFAASGTVASSDSVAWQEQDDAWAASGTTDAPIQTSSPEGKIFGLTRWRHRWRR